MLNVTENGAIIRIETLAADITFDAAYGGQIAEVTARDDLYDRPMTAADLLLSDITFRIDGARLKATETPAEMTVNRPESDYVVINTVSDLADGALRLTQEFEVHEEGAVFCEFAVETPPGRRIDLNGASLNLALDPHRPYKSRWGYFSRAGAYNRDHSTIHAFVDDKLNLELDQGAMMRELLPFIRLDLGWKETRFYSSHVEFALEDQTTYGDGPAAHTCTQIEALEDLWILRWHFLRGHTSVIKGSYRYRNRWCMFVGRARTQAGPEADPAVRNNALGARICHCMYPHAREGARWPWISMPVEKIPEQPPQLYVGNPELERVDEAAELGATMMIVHHFWMRHPGSNNEPPADYQPFDSEWLHAFTNRCHEHRMRVAYYVRGTEMWQQYATFFEDFLETDRDGLYADWNTPFCMGYVKGSPLHLSLHNYFHFTKALRRRVGDGGILIGHTNTATSIASACFDAALGGEVAGRHDEFLAEPRTAAYFAMVNAMGRHLISGNRPDRLAFSGPRAAAVCAAFGLNSHPFMEPDVPFAERVAFIKPLWDAMGALTGRIVRLHNPAYAPTRAVETENPLLFPSLWQADDGSALLLVTNLGDAPEEGDVTVHSDELDVRETATITSLPVSGTFQHARCDGPYVQLRGIPPSSFAALKIG